MVHVQLLRLHSSMHRRSGLGLVLIGIALGGAPPAAAGTDPLRMFVTSTSGSANLGSWTEVTGLGLSGLAAGDKICQVRAEAAGLATAGVPAFRAWLSITGNDAYCHVQGLTGTVANGCSGGSAAAGPWLRTDGEPFSGPLAGLVVDGPLSPASRTDSGGFLSALAWTGTNDDGTATGSTCGSWGLTTGLGTVGSSTSAIDWSNVATFGCGNSARLYCLAQGAGPELDLPTGPGALAFVTSEQGPGKLSLWASAASDGLAGGDEVCVALATAAGLPLPQDYVAWLSDAATDAKDRLPAGGPWNRVDGVRLATSMATLTDGNLDTALRVTESGAVLATAESVWTGTFTGGTKANHCVSWSSTLGADSGAAGLTSDGSFPWTTETNAAACDQNKRIYCFGTVVLVFWDDFESSGFLRWDNTTGVFP